MRPPRGPRAARAFLQVEHLENRINPGVDPSIIPLLPGQIAAGQIASDRVIVALNDGLPGTVLGSAYASEVRPIGFGMYSVRLTTGTDLGTALTYYGAVSGVVFAEPVPIVHLARKPNDPSYGQLYGPPRIGAERAWDLTTGNPNFTVAVIDSGVDFTHPDLAANIWINRGEIAGNFIDDDGNGYVDDVRGYDFRNRDSNPMDDNGHGTHVAGTIGAVGNNGLGVAGVNWAVKIMPLKCFSAGGSAATDDIVEAINYAVSMGAKVSNNSYGGYFVSQALGRAIGRSQSSGHIFVAASGNDGLDNDVTFASPTNYSTMFDNVVSVAATDRNDRLAGFSNYGAASVTLGAPGVGIVSTLPGGTYGSEDGTSMASPHVAGAIALYWGANPTLTYVEVLNKLKSSVDPVSGLAGKVSTGGRLNVAKMFNAVEVPPIVVDAPAGTEVVRVLTTGGVTQLALRPHPGFLGGIVSAVGDVTGDGTHDVVTAATLGGHVKVFDGRTGAELRSFFGFPGYRGPINLGVGDLNRDGLGDIIVAANLSGHIKVFDGRTGAVTFSQFVYPGYIGAIAVTVTDIDGDGRNDLVTAANGGRGVHVKAFTAGTMTLRDSFFATGPGSWPAFSISAADLDLDGRAELLVSQGPRVVVLNAQTKAVRADFIAFDPLSTDRITVQAGRYTGDPSAELVVVRETQGRSHLKVFDGLDFILADSFIAGTR